MEDIRLGVVDGVDRRMNGYMLVELMVSTVIILLICSMTAFSWHSRHDRGTVEAESVLRELVMEMQRVQHKSIGNSMGQLEPWRVIIENDRYTVVQGWHVYKEKIFSPQAHIPGPCRTVCFDELGRPRTEKMRFIIESEDKSFQRQVVIAAQTGRIRVEPVSL